MTKYCILLFFLLSSLASAQTLFDEEQVHTVYISIAPEYLSFMYRNPGADTTFKADFCYTDGNTKDTLKNIGLSLRGNTSRGAAKKSFKVSFNEYADGQRYRGIKKYNLLGSHNDPTQIRQKLFYHCWAAFGMPERRASFVKLFINGKYYGLYTQIEEFDKDWCERAFGNNGGNLYKCRYPADLQYLGTAQESYKAIKHSSTERAYDLKTNETADNYSDLVNLCKVLNLPAGPEFDSQIQKAVNVPGVLKALALEVMSGHWDDYAYNKNNYYLYQNTKTGKFEFLTYDADNTFGVDWLGVDWAKKDVTNWLPKSPEKRPLVSKLLASNDFNQMYLRYLDTIGRYVLHPDTIFPYITTIHNLIKPHLVNDPYYPLDYGYSMNSFSDGLVKKVDGHTPYGIFPFISNRISNMKSQTSGLLIATNRSPHFKIYPNPFQDFIRVETDYDGTGYLCISNVYGQIIRRHEIVFSEKTAVSLQGLASGVYEVYCLDQHGKCLESVRILKN